MFYCSLKRVNEQVLYFPHFPLFLKTTWIISTSSCNKNNKLSTRSLFPHFRCCCCVCSVCAVKSKEDFQTGLWGTGQPGRGQRGHHRVRWDLGLGCHFPPSHTSRDYFDFDRFDSPAVTNLWLVKATAFFPLIPPCTAERRSVKRRTW